jgi:hypothetical protein
MKTTMILDDTLIAKVKAETGITEKTRLVHMGLEALLEKISRQRLSNLYGKIPKAKLANRRRKVYFEDTN